MSIGFKVGNTIVVTSSRSDLQHSAKGSTWEEHKYVKEVDGKYYYPDDYEGGRHISNLLVSTGSGTTSSSSSKKKKSSKKSTTKKTTSSDDATTSSKKKKVNPNTRAQRGKRSVGESLTKYFNQARNKNMSEEDKQKYIKIGQSAVAKAIRTTRDTILKNKELVKGGEDKRLLSRNKLDKTLAKANKIIEESLSGINDPKLKAKLQDEANKAIHEILDSYTEKPSKKKKKEEAAQAKAVSTPTSTTVSRSSSYNSSSPAKTSSSSSTETKGEEKKTTPSSASTAKTTTNKSSSSKMDWSRIYQAYNKQKEEEKKKK